MIIVLGCTLSSKDGLMVLGITALSNRLRVFSESCFILSSLEEIQKLFLCLDCDVQYRSLVVKILGERYSGRIDGPHLRV